MSNWINLSRLAVCTLTGVAVSLCSSPAAADGRRDYYFQQQLGRYFDLPQTARTLGMAGSTALVSPDSQAVVGNPAALGLMEEGDISVGYGYNNISGNEHPGYNKIEENQNMGQALLALPLGPQQDALPMYGNLGFGWSGYDGDVDDHTLNQDTNGSRVHLSYGKALNEKWALGYGLAYIYDKLETDQFDFAMRNGFRHTAGVAGHLNEKTMIGSTVVFGHGNHDYETDLTETESDTFEFGLGTGLSHKIADATTLSFGVDYTFYEMDGDLQTAPANVVVGGDEDGHVGNARVGVEQEVNDWLDLRAGYRYASLFNYDFDDRDPVLSGSAKYNAWSAGVGFNIPTGWHYVKSLNLDYAAEYRAVGHDDWQHMVELSAPLTLCRP